jgi:diguanylate cyclase (GGDEF)-like protein/PAS domain S-box-containing protein
MDGKRELREASASPPQEEADVRPARSPADISAIHQKFIGQVQDVALLMLDPDGFVLTWNQGAEKLKGWRANEIIGQHFSTFYTAEAKAVGHPQRELELAGLTGSYSEDGWRVRKDGTRFWARVTIMALRNDDDELVGFGKVTQDLTESRQKEEQILNVLRVLEQTIRIDHLTGLPNRRAWDEHLAKLLADADTNDEPLAVAVLDLDHFKQYNDEFGHQAGDGLLKRAGLRWRTTLRPDDMLARYGGEEFVLALPGCTLSNAEPILARLLAATPDGQTLSAGVAVWDGEESANDLINRADRAMYDAKDGGRNCIRRAG